MSLKAASATMQKVESGPIEMIVLPPLCAKVGRMFVIKLSTYILPFKEAWGTARKGVWVFLRASENFCDFEPVSPLFCCHAVRAGKWMK